MKKTIIILASIATLAGAANAQVNVFANDTAFTASTGGGSFSGGVDGSAAFEFATNGGVGGYTITGTASALLNSGAGINYGAASQGTPNSNGQVTFTFDTAGEYIIRVSDFDVTTIADHTLSHPAGFGLNGNITAFNANGTFGFTPTTTSEAAISVVETGVNGAGGTNGGLDFFYSNITAGSSLTFTVTDNTGINDALAFQAIQVNPVVVPEPSSTALLGLGALGLLARRKR